ncbi:hypothetical protein HPP92_007296 [Vanilla planifolia]|uniref:THUMP domain-containing protein n=1 Tax=Vanilla planifolia TaxID=51239 RepID=A0A835V9A0_VANPL|nr:hypothetical protein HPP92_007296 [Vanilla planifolia]
MADLRFAGERSAEDEMGLRQGEEEGEHNDDSRELKPWEQHSAIISIPRYDYKAPSSLMERSHSGFLITCPIKREKSATKEAITILEEHISLCCHDNSNKSKSCSRTVSAKRKKMRVLDAGTDDSLEISRDRKKSPNSGEAAEMSSSPSVSDENAKRNSILSLVKLTRSGLLLFTLPNGEGCQVIDVLCSIFRSLSSANQKPPIWCHRIFPIQATCCLTEKDLQAVVNKLVLQYLSSHRDQTKSSIKFAVGYNRRGIEETEIKNQKHTTMITLLDRNTCFNVVAVAFKNVIENSTVDLKSPEVVVLVELLPLYGVPLDSLVVGVSVLPCELVMTKPRLCIRPLATNMKGKEGGLDA